MGFPGRPASGRIAAYGGVGTAFGDRERWYVPGALGEETATSVRPPNLPRGARVRFAGSAALAALTVAVGGCGGGGERQDADEPSGEFPVDVVAAQFPTEQRLAQTSDLRLEVENVGEEAVPDLAVTIWTGDRKAAESFSIESDQPGLADPNRPVWILENEFPKLLTRTVKRGDLDKAPSAGAEAVQTDTFSFGPLEPGDSIDAVWRVTPVAAGTYTVHYELAAGLNGKAKAVTADGSPVEGEFVVTISDKPPRARVNDAGEVEIQGE
jgi:hypothetical protein